MTRRTDTDRDWTRRGFVATAGATAAAALLPGQVSAQTEGAPDALFEDESLGGQVLGGGAFIGGLVAGVQGQVTIFEEPAQDIDRLVGEVHDEFEAHREDWLRYVNTRGLGGATHQSLGLTFEYDGKMRQRFVIADWDEAVEEYADVRVELEYADAPDVEATLRDLAVENAYDELSELHREYIVPDRDIERSHINYLAGRYYLGSDHVTASFLGGV